MARPPKKPEGDWIDALKVAMQIDPGLRKQREDRDRQEDAKTSRPPAGPRPPRTVEPHPDEPVAEIPPVVAPAPVEPAPPAKPASEFPWERPEPVQPPPAALPKLTLNFREADFHDPPPPRALRVETNRAAADDPPRPAPAAPAVPAAPRAPGIPPDRPVAGRPFLARPAPTASALRLTAAVEPLLQLVCRLNRMKRTGVLSERFRPDSLRTEFETALDHVVDVGDNGAAMEPPLRAFADVVMTKAGFPFARRWTPLTDGTAPPEQTFQQAAAAAVTSDAGQTDGTWAVYYACLCLVADLIPAAGNLPSGTELLDELDAGLYTKPSERYERVCPQAYEGVFDHPLLPSVGKRLRSIAVASVAFLLIAVAVAVALNVLYLRQMDESIGNVRRSLSHPDGGNSSSTEGRDAQAK
jgi:hypothetical protein